MKNGEVLDSFGYLDVFSKCTFGKVSGMLAGVLV